MNKEKIARFWKEGPGRKKILAPIVLALALLSMAGYWLWHTYGGATTAIQATGTIEATTVELNAKVAGTIKTFQVKAGDRIKLGQVVAELTRNDLVAQGERDRLSVLKAESTLNDLKSGARSQERNEAVANVNIARENYVRANDDYIRYESLLKAGAISQVDFEKARTAMEIARNQLQAVEARLSLIEEGSRPEIIRSAEAEVERSKAILKATEALLEDLQVISPLDGEVITKNYQEGEYVQMGASLATAVKSNDLWIKVYIPTDDLPHIRVGQRASFSVSGLSRTFEGIVEEIAAKGEFTPKTIQTKKERTNVVFGVKIRVSSEDGVLKPGMPADVTFERS